MFSSLSTRFLLRLLILFCSLSLRSWVCCSESVVGFALVNRSIIESRNAANQPCLGARRRVAAPQSTTKFSGFQGTQIWMSWRERTRRGPSSTTRTKGEILRRWGLFIQQILSVHEHSVSGWLTEKNSVGGGRMRCHAFGTSSLRMKCWGFILRLTWSCLPTLHTLTILYKI